MIFLVFLQKCHQLADGLTNGRTDGWKNGQTDKPSYKDARTHLKRERALGTLNGTVRIPMILSLRFFTTF